ncbi:MAG TPA: hypothetical protein VGK67_27775 [Myxococcales bacterium]|jgi:hypothetical protein
MPWRSRREGGLTTYRFASPHPVLGALTSTLFLAAFGGAGLVLLGLGLEDLSVTCTRDPRDPAPICRVVEGYLLGVYPVQRNAVGTTEARLVDRGSTKTPSLRLELVSKQGVLEIPAIDPGGNAEEKRALGMALQAWLRGSEPKFDLRVRLIKPLAPIGAPFALLALQLLLTLLFGLLAGLFAPQSLAVDERRRAVRIRPRGFARERELLFSDLAAIEASASLGGALGRMPPSAQGQALFAKLLGLHLHFVAKDGQRVVFRNSWRLSREDMLRLRDELARQTGLAGGR